MVADNLTDEAIISVYTGPDDTITALIDKGIDELKDMLRDARITTATWHDFVNDPELFACAKAQSPRQPPVGYKQPAQAAE